VHREKSRECAEREVRYILLYPVISHWVLCNCTVLISTTTERGTVRIESGKRQSTGSIT